MQCWLTFFQTQIKMENSEFKYDLKLSNGYQTEELFDIFKKLNGIDLTTQICVMCAIVKFIGFESSEDIKKTIHENARYMFPDKD